jgi:hypothetical protein
LDITAFALTCGILWAVVLVVVTWWVIVLEGSSADPTLISRVYRGHAFTPLGSLVGGLWGLVDGLIGGAVFAWVYNVIASRMSRSVGPSAA